MVASSPSFRSEFLTLIFSHEFSSLLKDIRMVFFFMTLHFYIIICGLVVLGPQWFELRLLIRKNFEVQNTN